MTEQIEQTKPPTIQLPEVISYIKLPDGETLCVSLELFLSVMPLRIN